MKRVNWYCCLILYLACLVHGQAASSDFNWDHLLEESFEDDPDLVEYFEILSNSLHRPAISYPYNSYVSEDLWESLKPYFLPIDHPLKNRLDRLFQKHRVTESQKTFEEAGFGKPKMRQPTNIVIGKNPRFPAYIFKVFLDEQPFVCEWDSWIRRIEGARAVQRCISDHHFDHFQVPQKWIYPLPEDPSPPNHPRYHRKNFILIAENMNILDSKANLKAFKKEMTPQMLEELYIILTEVGLFDSIFPSNIPFTKKGDIAFIDTEHHDPSASIAYGRLTPFLSTNMQKYWESLTKH